MVSRTMARDFYLSVRPQISHMLYRQDPRTRFLLLGSPTLREYSVLKEFSERLKHEVNKNKDLKVSLKELNEKAAEFKMVKDDLAQRTKQRKEQLYKQVDEVWSEAELSAKKVADSVKEKISAAREEVKDSFGSGKQESAAEEAESGRKANHNEYSETLLGKLKSKFPSNMDFGFKKMRDGKVTDLMKKGYGALKDELYGTPYKRKHLEYTPSPIKGEVSSRKDIAIVSSKESGWRKKWVEFVEKMRGHPFVKRINGLSEPVVTKGQEIAEDMREKWDTSDSPIVHKIQDVGDTIFQETDTATSIKEIRRRDPSFSLPDFVAEVQDAVRPVLNAYLKGELETLKKYCCPEAISRFEAERKAFESHGLFFDNKILHISDVEVRETKMMGNSPLIIIAFQTQQVHCVRDKTGAITEGGQDTIHTVYYAWAMQQIEPEEVGEGAIYPIWKLREMQQLGVQTLI